MITRTSFAAPILLLAVPAALLCTGCRVQATEPAPPNPAASRPAASTLPSGQPPSSANFSKLPIRPEDRTAEYDRDDWPHWSSHDGCSTRDLVLKREVLAYRKGEPIEYSKCDAVGNAYWVSHYDNVTVKDPSDLDIDHVVPLAEAAESGAANWTEQQRERFANDARNLIAVTASSNREKGADDPAEWLPRGGYRCEYVRQWSAVKAAYRLTVDPNEHAALGEFYRGC